MEQPKCVWGQWGGRALHLCLAAWGPRMSPGSHTEWPDGQLPTGHGLLDAFHLTRLTLQGSEPVTRPQVCSLQAGLCGPQEDAVVGGWHRSFSDTMWLCGVSVSLDNWRNYFYIKTKCYEVGFRGCMIFFFLFLK